MLYKNLSDINLILDEADYAFNFNPQTNQKCLVDWNKFKIDKTNWNFLVFILNSAELLLLTIGQWRVSSYVIYYCEGRRRRACSRRLKPSPSCEKGARQGPSRTDETCRSSLSYRSTPQAVSAITPRVSIRRISPWSTKVTFVDMTW